MAAAEMEAAAELMRRSPLDEHARGLAAFSDPFYGEVRLFVDPATRGRVALKELTFARRAEALEAARLAHARWRLLHPSLVPLLDFSLQRQSSLCARLYVLRLFYDFRRADLRSELDLRRQTRGHFSAAEMTLGMYGLLDLLRALQEKGVAHGRLCPQALVSQRAPFALRAKLVLEEPAAYLARQRARAAERPPPYLSPAMHRALAGRGEHACDPFVEDSFALGLLLLELGTLRSPAHCYLADGGFDAQALRELLALFAERYRRQSMILVALVEFLLLEQPQRRLSFEQLLELLPPLSDVEEYLRGELPAEIPRAPAGQHVLTGLRGGEGG